MVRRGLVAVIGLGIVLSQAVARGAEDKIRVRGKPGGVNGTIVEETPSHVKIRRARAERTITVNEIRRINYAGEPQSVYLARVRESSGQDLPKVLDAYKKGYEEVATMELKEKVRYDNLKRNLRFCEARVTAKLAASKADVKLADQAVELLTRFLEKNPTSRYHFPLHEHLAKMHLLKQDFDAARKALAVVAECPFPEWQLGANIELARIDMAQENYDKALKALEKIIAQTAKAEDETLKVQHQLATIQMARILLAKGDVAKAVKFLTAAIEKTPKENRVARAEAHNTLGDCYRAENKHFDALLEHLWVVLVYPDVREERARALYYAAECWDDLGQANKAAGLRQKLSVNYPNSSWNKKLRAE